MIMYVLAKGDAAMSKQRVEKTNTKAPVLIYAALGALFGSGAIIGVTVLTSAELGWRMFVARLLLSVSQVSSCHSKPSIS